MTEQMTCQEYRSHLDEWLDGELSEDLSAAMQAHRAHCADCDEETKLAEETLRLIHTLEPEEPVPLPVQAAWRSAVRKEAKQRSRFHWSAGMRTISAAAASFVALVGCTIGFRNTGMLDMAADKSAATESVQASGEPIAFAARIMPEQMSAKSSAQDIRYTYIASDSAVQDSSASAPTVEGTEEVMLLAETPAEDMDTGIPDSEEAEPMLIRSVSRTISTTSYDSDSQTIRDLTQQYGGYLAVDSSTSTLDGTRYSDYSCVLPADEVDNFLQALDHIGNVINASEYFTDVSADLADISAQLAVLRSEEARLTELISEASAEDLSALSLQLQSVTAEIDALQRQDTRLSNQLSHVTVDVRLEETIIPHTAEPTLIPELTDRMGHAFTSSAQSLRDFTHDMLVSLMVIAPFLLVIGGCAAVVIAIIWLIRRARRSGK